MLEAKIAEASVLKKLLDAIKELVNDANFECNEEGIHLQAMDNSHVALVAMKLQHQGFKKYRCDRPMPLGVNIASLTKVLKCAKDDDLCTLKAADEADVLNLVYEAKNSDRIAEYDLKLMDIDSDSLAIPDTDYDAYIRFPAGEFSRIVRDLASLGESVRIDVSKEGVRFAADGEAANGSVLLKGQGPITGVTNKPRSSEEDEEDNEEGGSGVKKEDAEDGDEDEDGEKTKKEKREEKKVKKEKKDEDVDMDEDEDKEYEEGKEDEGEDEVEEEESDEERDGKKRKKKSSGGKAAKKPKTVNGKSAKSKKKDDEEEDGEPVIIQMNSHVSLTFSLKYLVNFSKSSSLTNKVELFMSNDVPLLVSYDFGPGYIRYYLAPKIGDD
ncbi:proliferating cell nuclear antigen [Moniliophthora roreri]|uniref:DNA sliding clamp PCNA n=1 Tax=Moniliophthora roreri TaxID=221103 RepID=A0A0W0GDL6_MONRR|nr:proliferating cell nuclear antigen [Moniliophthora roreri]